MTAAFCTRNSRAYSLYGLPARSAD